MPQDFTKGKIYKITNDFNDEVYVGSTCNSIVKRMSSHKSDHTREIKDNVPLYKLMNEIGFERFRIQLIEDFPCSDKYELRQREGFYIRQMGTLNMKVAGRTKQSEDYKELKKEYDKKYQEANKEHLREIHNNYCQRNKEELKQYKSNWFQQNKERLTEQRKALSDEKKQELNARRRAKYAEKRSLLNT